MALPPEAPASAVSVARKTANVAKNAPAVSGLAELFPGGLRVRGQRLIWYFARNGVLDRTWGRSISRFIDDQTSSIRSGTCRCPANLIRVIPRQWRRPPHRPAPRLASARSWGLPVSPDAPPWEPQPERVEPKTTRPSLPFVGRRDRAKLDIVHALTSSCFFRSLCRRCKIKRPTGEGRRSLLHRLAGVLGNGKRDRGL